MHYKNGREAKAGDRVIHIDRNTGAIQSGLLHSTNPGNTSCNARLAVTTQSDPWVTVGDCIHADDIRASELPQEPVPAPAGVADEPAAENAVGVPSEAPVDAAAAAPATDTAAQ